MSGVRYIDFESPQEKTPKMDNEHIDVSENLKFDNFRPNPDDSTPKEIIFSDMPSNFESVPDNTNNSESRTLDEQNKSVIIINKETLKKPFLEALDNAYLDSKNLS